MIITLLMFLLVPAAFAVETSMMPRAAATQAGTVETTYDAAKDKTTIKLAPVKIGGGPGKYHSIHMSRSFSFSGRTPVTPAIVDFDIQTVVRGRLRTDLYVLFVIDGETVFLSSSRWAVRRPIPGRVWMGERLVFRMPYETFVRVTKANTFAIKFDGVSFPVGETEMAALRELLTYMRPAS